MITPKATFAGPGESTLNQDTLVAADEQELIGSGVDDNGKGSVIYGWRA